MPQHRLRVRVQALVRHKGGPRCSHLGGGWYLVNRLRDGQVTERFFVHITCHPTPFNTQQKMRFPSCSDLDYDLSKDTYCRYGEHDTFHAPTGTLTQSDGTVVHVNCPGKMGVNGAVIKCYHTRSAHTEPVPCAKLPHNGSSLKMSPGSTCSTGDNLVRPLPIPLGHFYLENDDLYVSCPNKLTQQGNVLQCSK